MRLLVTRPPEDAESLALALRDRDIEPVMEPLLDILFHDGPPLDLDRVQALLATSANGVRAFARREPSRHLPVMAVGDATARVAREAGFATVRSASGDVEALATLVRGSLDPNAGVLLHVAASKVAGDLGGRLEAAGFTCRREVLYEAITSERLSETTSQALTSGGLAGAIFYSPRTAATFVRLARAAGVAPACREMIGFCLSPAVAAKVEPLVWRGLRVAERPDEAALLAQVDKARPELFRSAFKPASNSSGTMTGRDEKGAG